MHRHIQQLYAIADKPRRTIIGLMSGTSLDGLDVAPGQSALYSNSALRMTWPAPNLTPTRATRIR